MTWGDGTDVHLQLWDIAGQDRYAQMTRPYFQGAHGALVVCDVTRSQSIECVQNWKDDIDKNLQNIPVVLVANKVSILKNSFLLLSSLLLLIYSSLYFCALCSITFLLSDGQVIGWCVKVWTCGCLCK